MSLDLFESVSGPSSRSSSPVSSSSSFTSPPRMHSPLQEPEEESRSLAEKRMNESLRRSKAIMNRNKFRTKKQKKKKKKKSKKKKQEIHTKPEEDSEPITFT